VTIGAWIADVRQERLAAAADLKDLAPPDILTEAEIRAMLSSMADILTRLSQADPIHKAVLLGGLGISLTFHPDRRSVTIEADLDAICTQGRDVRVGGASAPPSTRAPWRSVYVAT
jgi:hypothetical protein